MLKVILFLFFSSGDINYGPVKDIQTKHNYIPSLEAGARKVMARYGVTGGKFVFLTPYSENIKVEEDFSVIFLDSIKWNGHEFPSRMNFDYYMNVEDRTPMPSEVTLSRRGEPRSFKYIDATCRELTLTKKYVSCVLTEPYSLGGGRILPPSSVAFPMVPVSEKPKVEYVWVISKSAKIFGVQYKERDILKIKGNKIEVGEDENTASMNWGGKSD